MLRQTWRRSLRRGSRGEDVRHIQELLSRAGFDPGPTDGIFGARTESAVKKFQQSRQLQVDGIVGPITWASLTQPSGDGRRPRGRSLHIGLNAVNDAAYGKPVPPLRGCENDAREMLALAQAQGFSGRLLLSPDATADNVVSSINEAAEELQSGDFFLLTYAGHGSQMPDPTGEEPDSLDETWVLYDRQLLDDELYALWGRFRPDVRILVVSDSCHSGTMTRAMDFAYAAFASSHQDTQEVGFVQDTPIGIPMPTARDAAGWTEVQQAVRQVMPAVVGQLYGQTSTAVLGTDVDRYVELVFGQLRGPTRGAVLEQEAVTRNLPPDIADRDAALRRDLYAAAKRPTREAAPARTAVLLMSGCQDNQLSLDGVRNGLFTQHLLETWDRGRFSGIGYPAFHQQIAQLMPPQQTPNLFWAAGANPAFEQQRPFTIS